MLIVPVFCGDYCSKMLIFFLLLFYLSLTSQKRIDFSTTENFPDTFNYGNLEYILCEYRVSWDEARVICLSYKSELATVDTEGKRNFIVRAIADSSLSNSGNFWVGARRNFTDSWFWISNGQKLAEENILNNHFVLEYPDFITNESECLSIDRKYHDIPIFVPLRCNQQRLFVCQRERNKVLGKSFLMIASTKIGGKEFVLYSTRLTWPEAVIQCRREGLQIAQVETEAEAQSLAILMLRARPESIENVWIGGYKEKDKWKWLPSGTEIPKNNLWRNYDKNTEDCLLLDRHVCELPVYLEAKCDRKRNILCQKPSRRQISEKPMPVYVDGCFYWIGFYPLQWLEAKESCEKLNASLLILDSAKTISHAVNLMLDNREELKHIWTDGRRRMKNITSTGEIGWGWFWETTGEEIRDVDFVPWCLDEGCTTNDTNCLNLDRENHDSPIIYGLACDQRQTYMCQPRSGSCDVRNTSQRNVLSTNEIVSLQSSATQTTRFFHEDINNMQTFHITMPLSSSTMHSVLQRPTFPTTFVNFTKNTENEAKTSNTINSDDIYIDKENLNDSRIETTSAGSKLERISGFLSPFSTLSLPEMPRFGIKVVSAETVAPPIDVTVKVAKPDDIFNRLQYSDYNDSMKHQSPITLSDGLRTILTDNPENTSTVEDSNAFAKNKVDAIITTTNRRTSNCEETTKFSDTTTDFKDSLATNLAKDKDTKIIETTTVLPTSHASKIKPDRNHRFTSTNKYFVTTEEPLSFGKYNLVEVESSTERKIRIDENYYNYENEDDVTLKPPSRFDQEFAVDFPDFSDDFLASTISSPLDNIQVSNVKKEELSSTERNLDLSVPLARELTESFKRIFDSISRKAKDKQQDRRNKDSESIRRNLPDKHHKIAKPKNINHSTHLEKITSKKSENKNTNMETNVKRPKMGTSFTIRPYYAFEGPTEMELMAKKKFNEGIELYQKQINTFQNFRERKKDFNRIDLKDDLKYGNTKYTSDKNIDKGNDIEVFHFHIDKTDSMPIINISNPASMLQLGKYLQSKFQSPAARAAGGKIIENIQKTFSDEERQENLSPMGIRNNSREDWKDSNISNDRNLVYNQNFSMFNVATESKKEVPFNRVNSKIPSTNFKDHLLFMKNHNNRANLNEDYFEKESEGSKGFHKSDRKSFDTGTIKFIRPTDNDTFDSSDLQFLELIKGIKIDINEEAFKKYLRKHSSAILGPQSNFTVHNAWQNYLRQMLTVIDGLKIKLNGRTVRLHVINTDQKALPRKLFNNDKNHASRFTLLRPFNKKFDWIRRLGVSKRESIKTTRSNDKHKNILSELLIPESDLKSNYANYKLRKLFDAERKNYDNNLYRHRPLTTTYFDRDILRRNMQSKSSKSAFRIRNN